MSTTILVSILDYFQEKLKTNFLEKIQKEPILGQFWTLFTQIRAKMKTDRQADNSDFIRPSVGKFLEIVCLVRTQSCSKANLSPSL